MLLMGSTNWWWNTTNPQTTVEEGARPWTWPATDMGLYCLCVTI